MEIPQNSGATGTGYALISVFCGITASVAQNVELYVRIAAGVAAIAAAFMACRYHYYATKEKLKALKRK